MSRDRSGETIAPCPGPCISLRRDGGTVRLACLAADLPRARRRATTELQLQAEGYDWVASTPRSCQASFAFNAFGVRIAVRTNDPRIVRRIKDHLPPGWRPIPRARIVDRVYSLFVPRSRGFHALYADTARLGRARSVTSVLESLERDVELTVAERAPRRVFIHAGAAAWGGRALVLPGSSFSGKSTLVAELIRQGATYYSDEFAVLDARGRVHPYARRLFLRTEDPTERQRRSAASLGARTGTRPLPVGLVVVCRYRPRARWRPQRLSAGAGALALMANTVPVRRDPRRTLEAIQQVVATAPVVRGVRGEASQTARALLGALRGAGQPRPAGPGG